MGQENPYTYTADPKDQLFWDTLYNGLKPTQVSWQLMPTNDSSPLMNLMSIDG